MARQALRSSLVWTELTFGGFVPKVGDSGLPREWSTQSQELRPESLTTWNVQAIM